MAQVILIRHGQSIWNLENKFTGWENIDLSENGKQEALFAGRKIKDSDIKFDIAYTSILSRAIDTLEIILKEIDQENLMVFHDWRLNERHYGALQGLNKENTSKRYGSNQVLKWRRGYQIKPPEISEKVFMNMSENPLFKEIPKNKLPKSESLSDTVDRISPFIEDVLQKDLVNDKNVMISAHGNTLRALLKYLENISAEDIIGLEIPTGQPILLNFEKGFLIGRKYI